MAGRHFDEWQVGDRIAHELLAVRIRDFFIGMSLLSALTGQERPRRSAQCPGRAHPRLHIPNRPAPSPFQLRGR